MIFATKNENTTCQEISGKLHSLTRAALREGEFDINGRWEQFQAISGEMAEEEVVPDDTEAGFNPLDDKRHRDLGGGGCHKGDCWEGCTYWSLPRYCACCTCCHGKERRRLGESLQVSLGAGENPSVLEEKLSEIAEGMLDHWYEHQGHPLDCLQYPFFVDVRIDPIANTDTNTDEKTTRRAERMASRAEARAARRAARQERKALRAARQEAKANKQAERQAARNGN